MAQVVDTNKPKIIVVARKCLESDRLSLQLIVKSNKNREYFKFSYLGEIFYLQKYAGLQELDRIEIVTNTADLKHIYVLDIDGYELSPTDVKIFRNEIELNFLNSKKVESFSLTKDNSKYFIKEINGTWFCEIDVNDVSLKPKTKFTLSGWYEENDKILLSREYINFSEKMLEFDDYYYVTVEYFTDRGTLNNNNYILFEGKKYRTIRLPSNFPLFTGLKLKVKIDPKSFYLDDFNPSTEIIAKLITEENGLSNSDKEKFKIVRYNKNNGLFFFNSLFIFIITTLLSFFTFTFYLVLIPILVSIVFTIYSYIVDNPNIVKEKDMYYDDSNIKKDKFFKPIAFILFFFSILFFTSMKIDNKTYFDEEKFIESKRVYQEIFVANLQEWPEYKYYIIIGDGVYGDYRVTTVTYFFNKDPKLADFIKSFNKKMLDDAIGIRNSKYGITVTITLSQFKSALRKLSLNEKMFVIFEESEIKHIEK